MFRSGGFVADHVEPVGGDQVQPNGVDLTVDGVFEQREPGRVGVLDREVGARQAVQPAGGEDRDVYYLEPGGYVVQYAERVRVPRGHVGFILPRSTLLRNSCSLDTAVWDPGYEGRGEGLLRVHHDIELEAGAAIGQFVLAGAGDGGQYDGAYQGENL